MKELDGTMIMPFGVHKGKTLEDIPSSYLKWIVDKVQDNGDLVVAAEHEYDFRTIWGMHKE